MQKIVSILIFAFFFLSCSVSRRIEKENSPLSNNLLSVNVIESVKNQNLTNGSFFISKSEIEVVNENEKERFIGLIKFEYPDKYLISIKSRSGIEGMRIFISGDSIFANDRINRKLYTGTSEYFKRKYGLTRSLLPLILGDIVLDKSLGTISTECIGDNLNLKNLIEGLLLNYEIDCGKRKVSLVRDVNGSGIKGFKLEFQKFVSIGNILVPRLILLVDSKTNTSTKIKIIKIEQPWNGKVNFVPGKGYELIELL